MAVTVSELQVKVSADTGAAETGLSALGSKIGSVGAGLATAFGGAAIAGIAGLAAGFGASVAAAAGFESKMSAISAVSGATAAEMEQLTAAALDLGAKTSFSASEAAEGIGELVKAGVSIGDVLGGGAAAALNLAAAGGLSVAESAEIASNAMNVFGIKGSEVGHVADVIAGAANASAIDVKDFGMSLSAAGSVAATVGIGFDDLGTAIAVMGQNGIKGSDAGTSLKTMMLNLSPATDKAKGVMQQLGIITAEGANQFFTAEGKARSLAEISGVLQAATAGLTEQQKLQALQTIFGTDAIRAAAIMAQAGTAGFNEMAASIGKVTAEAVAAERLNNLKGDVEQLTGSLETAAIQIGMKFTPGLRAIVTGATETVNAAGPILEGFAESASNAIVESGRQITDAWRTVKQVFGEGWEADASIEPLALSAGNAATKLKEMAGFLQQVNDRAGQMGAWDNFASGVQTVATEIEGIGDRLGEMAAALDRVAGATGGAETKVTVLAAALRVVGAAFELWAVSMGQVHDTILTVATQALNMIGIFGNMGRALTALATGDAPAYEAAMRGVGESALALIDTHAQFADRSTERVSQAMSAIGLSAETGMATTTAAVETGMASSEAAVATGSAGMEAAMSTGMTGVVGAVEAQGPAAVAAAEAMGTGMAGGIEAAAPAMAAAAESGASGAVSAVQGQTGAASGAGQSLGQALGSGLEGGIMAYVGRVASAAAQLVSSAIGAARQEADARSPSRKMAKLGEDMVTGLEEELGKAEIGEDLKASIREFIATSREYIPVAGQIARVEGEIRDIRERSQTDALFRAERMITIDSEALRLKRDQVSAERDLLPLRQDLARASREVADIERGSLPERTQLLEMDATRKMIRLQEIELEKALIAAGRDETRRKAIQEQIDKLRDQDRLLTLEADRITTTNSIYATSARIRREGLDDNVRGMETVIQAIKDQIETLGAEQAVFQANENVIKNATDNEVGYRERLIAVFREEGRPLAERITAGLGLVTQLEKEGRISKELADRLREVAKEAGVSSTATSGLGAAAATAAPQVDAASRKAAEMALQARAIGERSNYAAGQVSHLAQSLGQLPSWFTPTGSGGGGGGSVLFPTRRDSAAAMPAPVASRGLFSDGGPMAGGGSQTLRIEVAVGGRVAEEIVVEGYVRAVQSRRLSPGALG